MNFRQEIGIKPQNLIMLKIIARSKLVGIIPIEKHQNSFIHSFYSVLNIRHRITPHSTLLFSWLPLTLPTKPRIRLHLNRDSPINQCKRIHTLTYTYKLHNVKFFWFVNLYQLDINIGHRFYAVRLLRSNYPKKSKKYI